MPVFQLRIDPSGVITGAKSAENAMRGISKQAQSTQQSLLDMSGVVQKALAAFSGYKIAQQFAEVEKIGIRFNDSWESSKLAIASTVGALSTLKDEQGRVLQGAEKFAAVQGEAEKIMKRVQILGLETTATTQELVNGVQGMIAPALRVGVALEKIPDLAVNIAQAMGAMQLPLAQMRTEAEALLTGNINKSQDMLATNLGITGEMVRSWQKQGTLIDEINKRLETFKLSGQAIANTWGGLTSNLKEYVEFTAGQSTTGLFDGMKVSVRELQQLMIEVNKESGKPEISGNINNLVDSYTRLNDVIGDKVLSVTRDFADMVAELNKTENLQVLEDRMEAVSIVGGAIYDAFSNVAGVLADVAGAGAGIAENLIPDSLQKNADALANALTVAGGAYLAFSGYKKIAASATLGLAAASTKEYGALKTLESGVLSLKGANTELSASELNIRNELLETEQAALKRERSSMSSLKAQLKEASQLEKATVGYGNHAQAVQRVTDLKTKYQQASVNVTNAQNAVAKATANLNKPLLTVGQLAGSAGKSLLAAFGGPAGIAITALGGAAMYLASQESLAEKAARDHADALSVVTSGANKAADAMQGYLDRLREKSNFDLAATITKAKDSYAEFVKELSRLPADVYKGSRNFSAYAELNSIVNAYRDAGDKSSIASKQLKDDLESLGLKYVSISGIIQNFFQKSQQSYDAVALSGETAASLLEELQTRANLLTPTPLSTMASSVATMNTELANSVWWIDSTHKAFDDLNGLTANLDINFSYNGNAKMPEFAPAQEGNSMLPVGWLAEFQKKANGAAQSITVVSNATGKLGEKSGGADKTASALKSVTSELAKLQLTDAQYQQWQAAQKIADLEKSLGKANPKVKELQALLQNDLEAKFLQSIQEYADPATAQLAKLQKEYQKVLDTVGGSKSLNNAQKNLFNTQAAKQYEKALEGVAGTSQSLAKISREQEKAEAELSGNRTRWLEIRREELEDLYGLENRLADKAQVSAAVDRQLQIERMQKEGDNAFNFSKLWEETYKRVDEAGADMIEGFLTGSKNGLDSLKNMFVRTLAEMANAALLRPITVSVMGTMGGVIGGAFGGSGTANAAGQMMAGSGGGFNIPGFNGSSLFNGISDTINESMMNWFPSTFGTGMVTNFAGSAGSLTSGTLSTAAINSIGGSGYGGMAFAPGANLPTFTSSIAPALGWGSAGSAVGGMVSPYFNNMLGINNGKNAQIGSTVGGLGATGVMAGLAAANMWNPGGWVMAGVSALSSLFGGSMGGMFDKKPKRPAVWGGAEIDLGSDNLYAPGSYDFGATFDPKGYGRDSFEMYEDGNYAIATRSRNKASSDVAKAMSQIMREVAEMGVKQADAVQEALPDSYAAAFKEQLSANTISAEWDFKGDDINEESFKQAAAELQEKVNASMLSAFQGMDFAEYAGKINVDQSAIEGLNKFTTAIKLTEETIKSTAEIANPISQLEQQANAAKAQLDEWTKAMKTAGVTTEYAGQLMTDYSNAMIGKFIGDMEESLNPLSQYAQAMKDANTAVDDRLAALTVLGATEAELARVEGLRAQVLEQTTGPMKLAFEQDLQVRQAQLSGNAELLASTQLTIQHERELAEIRAKFGQDSSQFEQIEAMQVAEKAQLAWQQAQARGLEVLQNQAKAAQSALDAMNTTLSEANKKFSDVQSHLNAVRSAYLSALNKEASAIQSTMDAVSRAVEQLSRTRRDLLTNAEMSPLGTTERYALTGAELERVFAKAMSGDADAMNELAGLSSKYLDVSKEANADFSKYRKDFERVQAMLSAVETSGNVQVSESQKQIDLLNAQIAAATEGTGQIVGSIKELEAAFLQALGDYNAAQEAARKAQEAAEEARRKAEEAANNAQNSSENSQKSWMQDVLERKAAQLNSVGEASWGVSAGNWTPDEVLRAIFGNGLTFESWYKQFGQIEGFAKGGLASGWAMVGEEGPELVNFSNPGRVYTADDTANMLNPRQSFQAPALSVSLHQTGNGNAELIAEIKALRREVAELRADQSRSQFRIADAAQRTARKLEGWDFDGMPEERK